MFLSLLSAHNFVKGYSSSSNWSRSNILVLIPQSLLFAVLYFVLKHLKLEIYVNSTLWIAVPGKLVCVSSDITILVPVIAFRAQSGGTREYWYHLPLSQLYWRQTVSVQLQSSKVKNRINGKLGSLQFGLNIFKLASLVPSVANVLFSINQLSEICGHVPSISSGRWCNIYTLHRTKVTHIVSDAFCIVMTTKNFYT